MSNARPLSQESTMIEFEGKGKSSLSPVLVAISLLVAVAFLVFILLSNRTIKSEIAVASAEKEGVDSELALPANANVISESKSFEEAVNYLTELNATRVPKSDILTELYTYITKDVRISNLSLSEDGTLGLDGFTSSYRSAADLLTALKSYKRISNVRILNVSLSEIENAPEKERFTFSISATLDLTKIEPEIVAPEATTTDVLPVPDTTDEITPAETVPESAPSASTVPDSSDLSQDNSYQGY